MPRDYQAKKSNKFTYRPQIFRAHCLWTFRLVCVRKSRHTRGRNAAGWKVRETQGETAGGARSTAAQGVGGAECQQINKCGKSGRARKLSIARWKNMKDVLRENGRKLWKDINSLRALQVYHRISLSQKNRARRTDEGWETCRRGYRVASLDLTSKPPTQHARLSRWKLSVSIHSVLIAAGRLSVTSSDSAGHAQMKVTNGLAVAVRVTRVR